MEEEGEEIRKMNEEYARGNIYFGKKQFAALPLGWECKKTVRGREYFIDHINRKTQWKPPNLIKKETNPSPIIK